jgi:hypothetical protein
MSMAVRVAVVVKTILQVRLLNCFKVHRRPS